MPNQSQLRHRIAAQELLVRRLEWHGDFKEAKRERIVLSELYRAAGRNPDGSPNAKKAPTSDPIPQSWRPYKDGLQLQADWMHAPKPDASKDIRILERLRMGRPGYVAASLANPTGQLRIQPSASHSPTVDELLQEVRDRVSKAVLQGAAREQIYGHRGHQTRAAQGRSETRPRRFHVDPQFLEKQGVRDVDAMSAKYMADFLNDDPEPELEIEEFQGPTDRKWTVAETYEGLINTLQRARIIDSREAHFMRIGKPNTSLWDKAKSVGAVFVEDPDLHYNARKMNQLTKVVFPYGPGAVYGPRGLLSPKVQEQLSKSPEGVELLSTVQNLDPTQFAAMAETVTAPGGLHRTAKEYGNLFKQAAKGDPYAIAQVKGVLNAVVISVLARQAVPIFAGPRGGPAFSAPSKPGSLINLSGGSRGRGLFPVHLDSPRVSANNSMLRNPQVIADTQGNSVVVGAGRPSNRAMPGTKTGAETVMTRAEPRLVLSEVEADRLAAWTLEQRRLPDPEEAQRLLNPKGSRGRAAVTRFFSEDQTPEPGARVSEHLAKAEVIARRAAELKPSFDVLMDKIARQFGGKVDHGPSKLASRIAEKLIEYKGATSRIKDAIRSSIVVSDVTTARNLMAELREMFPGAIVKDSFDRPMGAGYRDLKVWIPYKGTMAEIAIHVPEMYAAKKLTHPLYSRSRVNGDGASIALMTNIHNRAWAQYRKRTAVRKR